jgi:hypothetical protein
MSIGPVSYNNLKLTPLKVIGIGFLFLSIFSITLFSMGFYADNEYFRWGPPLYIFKKNVTSNLQFYGLLIIFFLNQIINTLVTEVVYSWIVNCVQDPKSKTTYYSKKVSIFLVLSNAFYFSTNLMLVINGAYSQISFFFVTVIGNMMVIGYTNKKFIDRIFNEANEVYQNLTTI